MMPASNRDVSDDLGLQASQSMDCEPTPPIQRHGSKNNFFHPQNPPPEELDTVLAGHVRYYRYVNGSPHPNRQRYRN